MSRDLPISGRSARAVVLAVAGLALSAQSLPPLTDVLARGYRPFVVPSEAMLPTLEVQDRLVAKMSFAKPVARGDLVMIEVGDSIWIKRVAAIPGDRIAVKGGLVELNGRILAQRDTGKRVLALAHSRMTARILSEQFPGEAKPHLIADSGPGTGDDYPLRTMRPDEYFMLGDNRDNSADSRFEPRQGLGLGSITRKRILGRAEYIYWRKRTGDVRITL